MLNITEKEIRNIGEVLKNEKRPLKERFRALFTLRNIGGSAAIDCIKQTFNDSSALLKHELAYCLGQMQDSEALAILIAVLEDKAQEPMVRHEAGEAIGAIGSSESLAILKQYSTDSVIEVAETCQLALQRIEYYLTAGGKSPENNSNPFLSVDPAPPMVSTDITLLKAILLDDKETLFNRYRAMFSLRNLRKDDAVLALCEGLNINVGSALFRHEVAFVLGQLQESVSVPALHLSLANSVENEMVRHECAEALGAIATNDCTKILNEYLQDEKQVVRESCEIALDMCEYENSPEFQYANTLVISGEK